MSDDRPIPFSSDPASWGPMLKDGGKPPMSDDRLDAARRWLAAYPTAATPPRKLIADLVAEVERLRVADSALRAVLDLHKSSGDVLNPYCVHCTEIAQRAVYCLYPCKTLQAMGITYRSLRDSAFYFGSQDHRDSLDAKNSAAAAALQEPQPG